MALPTFVQMVEGTLSAQDRTEYNTFFADKRLFTLQEVFHLCPNILSTSSEGEQLIVQTNSTVAKPLIIEEKKLDYTAMDNLFRKVNLRNDPPDLNVSLDLSNIVDFNAVGVLNLGLLIAKLQQRYESVTLIPPDNRSLSHYLLEKTLLLQKCSRMSGQTNVEVQSNLFSRIIRPPAYLPPFHFGCYLIKDSTGKMQVVSEIFTLLHNKLAIEFNFVSAFCQVFTELCGNSVEHSQSAALATIQIWKDSLPPRIMISLGDLGIGIRGSLENANKLTNHDDRSAIVQAVTKGLSSKKDENRGRGGGLPHCLSLAAKYSSLNYAFAVRSGSGFFLLHKANPRSESVDWFPGTQAYFGFLGRS